MGQHGCQGPGALMEDVWGLVLLVELWLWCLGPWTRLWCSSAQAQRPWQEEGESRLVAPMW